MNLRAIALFAGAAVSATSSLALAQDFSVDDLLGDAGAEVPAAEQKSGSEVSWGGYAFDEARLFFDRLGESERAGSTFDSWGRAYFFTGVKLGPLNGFRVSAALNVYTRTGQDGTSVLYSMDLDEAYYSHGFGPVRLTVGSQTIAWGVMDSLSPEDRFNPYDLRFLVGEGHDDGAERVSVLAARAVWTLPAQHRLDLAFVPFGQPSRVFLDGTNFSFLRPGLSAQLLEGYRRSVAATVPEAEQPAFRAMADSLEARLSADPRLQAHLPSGTATVNATSFEQPPEGGLRLSGSTSAFDYGIVTLTAHERLPRFEISEELKRVLLGPDRDAQTAARVAAAPDAHLVTGYPRFWLVGADAGVRLDAFIVKLEGSLRSNATYYTADLDAVGVSVLDAAAHVEYLKGMHTGVVVEALLTHALTEERLIFADRDNVRLSARFSLGLARDTLRLRVEGAYDTAYRDFFIAPDVAYEISDHWIVSAGAAIFGGDGGDLSFEHLSAPERRATLEVGPFEYYESQSFGSLKVKYGF